MKVFETTLSLGDVWLRRLRLPMLVGALTVAHIASARADATPQGVPTEATVPAFAMHWFTEMQAGRTDRSEYTAAYGAQLTDEAVQEMSRTLNRYGASSLRAEIVHTRKIGKQTFYVVKFNFPRGDATSLLFGFDTAGKITSIAVGGLAGD
jgi:hypothetical protein